MIIHIHFETEVFGNQIVLMLWEQRPRRDQPGDAKGTANNCGEDAAPTDVV